MIPERIKARLSKDRPMTSITVRMPVDVVESMKEIAPQRGFSGYQALLKAYVSEGLRRDEAEFSLSAAARLIEELKKRGIPEDVLDEASREVHSGKGDRENGERENGDRFIFRPDGRREK